MVFIPAAVKKVVAENNKKTDNTYLNTAEKLFGRLEEIRTGKCEYIDPDMATLANTLELYYKGLLLASGVPVPEDVMKESHSLSRLMDEINTKVMPLFPNLNRSDLRDMKQFLRNLSALYIDTRYHGAQKSFEEFKECLQLVTQQREYIMSTLDPERSWDKSKPNAVVDRRAELFPKDYVPSQDAVEIVDD